jgi:phenylalanyl-tRNA synthetase beta chain
VLFDVYRPKKTADGSGTGGLAADEKSLAVRLTLNRDDATLTDEEIEAVVKDVLDRWPRVSARAGAERQAINQGAQTWNSRWKAWKPRR